MFCTPLFFSNSGSSYEINGHIYSLPISTFSRVKWGGGCVVAHTNTCPQKVRSVWWARSGRSELIPAPRHPAPAFSLLLPRLAPSVAGSFALFLLVLLSLLVHVPQGFCLLSLLWDRNNVHICVRPHKSAAHDAIRSQVSNFPSQNT